MLSTKDKANQSIAKHISIAVFHKILDFHPYLVICYHNNPVWEVKLHPPIFCLPDLSGH